MLPSALINFLDQVWVQTENGKVKWSYDPEEDSVESVTSEFALTLRYHFNQDLGLGQMGVYYYNNQERYYNNFSTNQFEKGYDTARGLFDSAQASTIPFPTF